MAETELPPIDQPAPKRPLIQIVVVVLLAAILGLLAYIALQPKGDGAKDAKAAKEAKAAKHEEEPEGEAEEHGKEAKAEEHEEEEEGHGEKAAEGGHGAAPAAKPTVKVADIVVKLNDPDDDRYIKLSVDLEVKNEPHKVAVTAAMPKIRDAIISYLSEKAPKDLEAAGGLAMLKHDLQAKMEEVVPRKVRNLYVSDFIVQ